MTISITSDLSKFATSLDIECIEPFHKHVCSNLIPDARSTQHLARTCELGLKSVLKARPAYSGLTRYGTNNDTWNLFFAEN